MSTEPRTVAVNVFVHKALEIDEPDWCAGQHGELAQYKVDISHDGPEHVCAPDGRELFRAFLTQAPFSSVNRTIGLYVEFANLTGTCTPDEVAQLADDLNAAASQLRELGQELAAMLSGGDR
ncbi:hypothetical protein M2158_001093 [Streptomyces sp. SAI-144]|uniref:DUF6907 domain-containing protein n=1 Tax=Streptomyces sp. SAI-144 TaxID=2940544 RepID=UPI002475A800|nr:hypothetical protein [Streptomyces sp. SAI-144]MDH6432616.1 hypothetical protein [Streptomyces sp. SAI-144]